MRTPKVFSVRVKMAGMFQRLWGDRAGSSLIEYSMLVGIVIALALVVVSAVGAWAQGVWVNLLHSLG